MKSRILFSEEQRFTQPWLWILLAGVMGVVVYGAFTEMIFHPVNRNVWGGIAMLFIPVLIVVLFTSFNLQVEITAEGIYYRFKPLHRGFNLVKWDKVKQASVRKYRPLAEYGGWGMRITLSGSTAYNVRGNMGLQLELENGKKILIGTQKPDELAAVLRQLGFSPGT